MVRAGLLEGRAEAHDRSRHAFQHLHALRAETVVVGALERFDPAKAPLLYAPVIVNGARVARNPATGQTGPAVLIGGLVPGTGDITNGTVPNNDPNYPAGFIENLSVLY